MKKEELLAFFFAEVEEQLEMLEQEILRLEADNEDKEIIQNIFRYAHSIKGSSASMGFQKLKDLTHQMEYILDLIRKEQLQATQTVVDALFACLDVLRELKEQYQQDTDTADITEIVQTLQQLQTTEVQASSAPTTNSSPTPPLAHALPKEVEEALQKGVVLWCAEITFAERCATKTIRAHIVKKEIEKLGSLIAMDATKVEDNAVRKVWFYVQDEQEQKDQATERIKKIVDVETVTFQPVTLIEKPKKKEKTVKKTASPTIRVDVAKIEKLMNLVGEIIIDQTMVMQLTQDMKERGSGIGDAVTEQERILKHMARVVSEFQENIMKTRMLPIEQLFSRFPRIVRDLSQQLGKDIDLVMEGGETEIDRTVIEEITDPMIHIIRNSIDHGIEPNDIRQSAGKPRGVVTITATHRENQVVLTVRDDGAGIDAEKIKASAIKKGVITAEQGEKMTERELVHLVFHPGFSTAEQVSDVSGRGVGMDVVRNHIEKLNGLIEIDTEKGKGTTMTIKLPLTLAILKGFLVDVENRTFTIPMNSVIEIFKLNPSDIQSVNGEEMTKIRDKTIPLIRANEVLGFEGKREKNQPLIVMMIGLADKRIGLVVERLIGNQEIVIKPLGPYIGAIPAISGSTILGDGRVSLILDVAGIFKWHSEQKGVMSL